MATCMHLPASTKVPASRDAYVSFDSSALLPLEQYLDVGKESPTYLMLLTPWLHRSIMLLKGRGHHAHKGRLTTVFT